ncbi:MAG: DUF6166 domain-containing protein [Bacteroidota bacterium]
MSHDNERLGEVPQKHVSWLRPLLDASGGVQLRLTRVTGSERGYTVGCNIALTGIGGALERLRSSLHPDDGSDDLGPHARPYGFMGGIERAQAHSYAVGGDGATERPRVSVAGDSEDIRLWRGPGGTAHATVPHVVTYSPTGLEWGYIGGGPGDLAVSILTYVAGEEAAAQHAHVFTHDIVARIPREGGVLRAAAVEAWLLARTTDLSA